MDLIIQRLTKPVLKGNLNQFINILYDVPGEYWDANHFMMNLPGKFKVSCCAFIGDNLVCYIISSFRNSYTAHIHKFMTAGSLRGKKIGQTLYHYFEDLARANSINEVTLKVPEENTGAIKFYKKIGFEVYSQTIDSVNTKVLLQLVKTI